jgi:uncharacterized protein (DUF427 family)
MKAVWNGQVIAEADRDKLVYSAITIIKYDFGKYVAFWRDVQVTA